MSTYAFEAGQFVNWTGYTWSVVIVREILPDNHYKISYADFYNKMKHTEVIVPAHELKGETRLTAALARVRIAETALDTAVATFDTHAMETQQIIFAQACVDFTRAYLEENKE